LVAVVWNVTVKRPQGADALDAFASDGEVSEPEKSGAQPQLPYRKPHREQTPRLVGA
jgi:hypothetical protein